MANRVIEMRPDGVTEYLGNYDDYLEEEASRRLAGDCGWIVRAAKTRTQLDKEKRTRAPAHGIREGAEGKNLAKT